MKKEISSVDYPELEGKLYYLKDLPVGTRFFVCKGYWVGEIIEEAGVKKYLIECTREKVVIEEDTKFMLEMVSKYCRKPNRIVEL